MDLNEFYSLRKDFTIIGLTGRSSSGSREVAEFLSTKLNEEYIREVKEEIVKIKSNNINEGLKYGICLDFIKYEGNWNEFKILKYRNVLLLHLLHQSNFNLGNNSPVTAILSLISEAGEDPENTNKRFGHATNKDFFENELKLFLESNIKIINSINFKYENLNEALKNEEDNKMISNLFFNAEFERFANDFFDVLDRYDPFLRHLLLHDIAYNLRAFGGIRWSNSAASFNSIYTIADTINRIIKSFRRTNPYDCNIVIDSLKNSLELMYFKEKYSAFYMIASNKLETSRCRTLEKKLRDIKGSFNIEEIQNNILSLDETEYRVNDFKEGIFASADIENCIQKSDYHIFIKDRSLETEIILNKKTDFFEYISYKLQLFKLVSLIKQPGIVTPSALERNMQIAFNAKLSSGCISRQVGAVITDKYYSVKSIGWNEVAEGQTPCSLRNIYDLKDGKNGKIFTEFEKETHVGSYNGETFIKKVIDSIGENNKNKMEGRNCPFCFKTFHNKFEGKENQVHTRSLHAEENAMLQITKYGGQPIKGGNLFTTASPCELCSKKAYQLGIKNIFYIDPYPGIAIGQILSVGSDKHKPNLYMFQGAVGRGYNKLYEPFISIKDETAMRSGIKPLEKPTLKSELKNILDNKSNSSLEEVMQKLNNLVN